MSRRLAILFAITAMAACSPATANHSSPTAAGATSLPSPRDPDNFRVEGESMVPLLPNGAVLVADRAAYADRPPARGDIVAFTAPGRPNLVFIKRIIGLPGDEMKIAGRYVDANQPDVPPHAAILIKPAGQGPWRVLREPYLPDQSIDPWNELDNCCDQTGRATALPTELRIPDGEYFILGDNRNRSPDSRSIGLIPAANLLAKCLYRLRNGAEVWLYSANLQLAAA